MTKKKFFPFTVGLNGGKANPWILSGNNYANLNIILAKGRSLGITVAPVLWRKATQNAPLPHKQHEAAAAFFIPVQKVLNSLPAASNTALAPAAKYLATAGRLPRSSALGFNNSFVAKTNHLGSKYTALAQGQPGSFVHAFGSAQRDKAGIALRAIGKANPASALSKLSSREHETLPGIAPMGHRNLKETAYEPKAAGYLDTNLQAARHYVAPAFEANRKTDPRQLSGALDELLNRAARRPPTGTSAFDPRLTPAWAGLQLPA